jgi:glycerophosphoryl diester phosphodiesterase
MFLTIILLFMYVLGIIQGLTRPLIIGHRGTAYLPELTLATQSMAHAYGADIIEIDVCLSRDDQLIVIHGKNSTYQSVNIVLFST